ncbi:MAG: RNA polymerase sigma factor [Verrucomicrobiae bacterium]|nr:RNA polymerase sigma factor [Verrucomicrobiae bacterium]
MNPESPDSELVGTYAREGSETAFRALVGRHVNLVFGIALRQIGDAGIAEEVTQNVFIALARKAPRLARHETVAGWLHRTAILECKARLRAELRRQRREQAAAVMTLPMEAPSPDSDLSVLLDEGLLHLREGDRLAVILRYLEERSLREVAGLLGVEEDAARKRVDRAVERLAEFFRSRGVAASAGASVAALARASAASAAPPGLAAAAGTAGLAGVAGGGALAPLAGLATVSLSNLQTAGLCLLLVAAPVGWQWHQHREVRRQEAGLRVQRDDVLRSLDEALEVTRRTRADRVLAEAEAFNARRRLEVASQAAAAVPTPAGYAWDDQSPLARVPKEFVRHNWAPAVAPQDGRLTDPIQELLQMTPEEAVAIQAALDAFSTAVEVTQAGAVRQVEPLDFELEGQDPAAVRVFEIRGVGEALVNLRTALLSEVDATLGQERSEIFRRALGDWIPMDDDNAGVSSGWAYHLGDHRIRFLERTGNGESGPILFWGVRTESGAAFTAPIQTSQIPGFLRPHLQDWLDALAADVAAEAAAQGQP